MRQVVGTALIAAALIALAGSGVELPAQANASFPVALALSSAAMDFNEGLDARDELGRPVTSLAARRQLKHLFVSTVFGLLTRPELPQRAAVLAALDKIWNVFMAALGRPVAQGWQSFVDLGLPSTRKAEGPPLLMFASAALSLALLVRRRADVPFRTKAVLNCISSTVLRC